MPHSFFQLTPDPEPVLTPFLEPFDYCAYACGAYTEAEHEAIVHTAEPLGMALVAALNAYIAAHPGLSYAAIFHAIDYLAYALNHHLDEDSADA